MGLDENDLSATQLFNHGKENRCNFILPENQLHPDACQAQQGLSTASGRPITVSKDALARAKNLLGDLRSEDEIIMNEERLDGEISPKSFEMDLHENRITGVPANEVRNQICKDFGKGKENAFPSKRKPTKISSVAPFKRPRSSRFDLISPNLYFNWIWISPNFFFSSGYWILQFSKGSESFILPPRYHTCIIVNL